MKKLVALTLGLFFVLWHTAAYAAVSPGDFLGTGAKMGIAVVIPLFLALEVFENRLAVLVIIAGSFVAAVLIGLHEAHTLVN